MSDNTASGGRPYLFDAVLRPNRSLSPLGFCLLMAAIAAVSFTAGLIFVTNGAWPVFGFYGLDVALVYWAFRANYRSGRAYETVRLTRSELVVERVAGPRSWGRKQGQDLRWSIQPYWLRVEIDDPPEHHSQLTLRSHGRSLTIGAALAPEERLEVARALSAALARLRVPEMP